MTQTIKHAAVLFSRKDGLERKENLLVVKTHEVPILLTGTI
jgi:hypothetical protein